MTDAELIRKALEFVQWQLDEGDLKGAVASQQGVLTLMTRMLEAATETTVTEGATADAPEDQTRWTNG